MSPTQSPIGCCRPGGSDSQAGCVYSVCMARVNVYLPDDLAERARSAGVNVSGVAQDAIRGALASLETDVWLDRLDRLPRINLRHETVMTALEDARDEFGA
jgi:post-segregation antitoxin (ccd killing protein)